MIIEERTVATCNKKSNCTKIKIYSEVPSDCMYLRSTSAPVSGCIAVRVTLSLELGFKKFLSLVLATHVLGRPRALDGSDFKTCSNKIVFPTCGEG